MLDPVKISKKLLVVESAVGDTVEIHFGAIKNADLLREKLKVSEALNHFNPKGKAIFCQTDMGDSSLLTLLFIPNEDAEGVEIVED